MQAPGLRNGRASNPEPQPLTTVIPTKVGISFVDFSTQLGFPLSRESCAIQSMAP